MSYKTISLTGKEWLKAILIYFFGAAVIAYFFYRSVKTFFLLIPGFLLFVKVYKRGLVKNRKKKLLDEFSECLYSVSISMKSGYSIENAFLEAYKDMQLFYGENSLMGKEIEIIRKGLEINLTIEELIEDLAVRSEEKDIIIFSDICKSAKRDGGNVTEVLSNTADRIRSGICTDKEIDTILSEKKLELRIMEAVPFLLMAYLEVTSVGYFNVLYSGMAGRVFMSGCLILYLLAVFIGNRILQIEV